MNRFSLLSVFLSLYPSLLVVATEGGDTDYGRYTPQQIMALPDDERKSAVPLGYLLAAQLGSSDQSDILFAGWLNTLMYPGIGDFEKAVKLFQSDLGDDLTGELTVGQIQTLEYRSDFQRLGRVGFPSRFQGRKFQGYGQVVGTFTILGEKIGLPVNLVTIECHQSEMYCSLEQLSLMFPQDESGWAREYEVMKSYREFFDVVSWEEHTIDAVHQDSATSCRAISLNLNFKSKEFYQITRNGSVDCDVSGVPFPPLSQPRIAQIVDGAEIISAEFQTLRQKATSFYSSEFRQQLERLAK